MTASVVEAFSGVTNKNAGSANAHTTNASNNVGRDSVVSVKPNSAVNDSE